MKYSFVLMLIRLSSLDTTRKFQKNFCFKMRPVGLIYINTKECKLVAIYESGLLLTRTALDSECSINATYKLNVSMRNISI